MAKSTGKISIGIESDEEVVNSSMISKNQGVHQGVAFFVKITIPAYDNVVTTTISILDADGDSIYSIPGLAMGTTHVISDLQFPLVEKEVIRLTLTGVPGGIGPYVNQVTIYYVSDY